MQHISTLKILFITLFLVSIRINAQELHLNFNNQPLSEVLVEIGKKNNIQFSFDHQLLSDCRISISKTCATTDEAISVLIENCKLEYEISNGVYIIFKNKKEDKTKKDTAKYYYSGRLYDIVNTEPLPYSYLNLLTKGINVDVNGNFAFKSPNNKEKLMISHLGYYVLDTIIKHGSNQEIGLTPSVIGLKEVIVNSDIKIYNTHIGKMPGLVKLNHKTASFLPGNNNNTLFNLLRLQPGILAAAEQSGEYIIRGSYMGQTLLLFDGIPLFSANSLNKEIGIINPLIVKDVEIFKSGYNVDKGERVGGIINLTGNTGNTKDFSVKLNVNSQTVSGLLNVPISNKFAFQAAFRQSYFSVFDWNNITNKPLTERDEYFTPDFTFQDLNLKFSGKTNNGDNFYISLIGNNDKSEFNIEEISREKGKVWENYLKKQQVGASAFYNKKWRKGGNTRFHLVYSDLTTSSFDRENPPIMDRNVRTKTYYRENGIEELSSKIEHQFTSVGIHEIKTGMVYTYNLSGLSEDSIKSTLYTKDISSERYSFYLKDKISLNNKIELQPGVKVDYLPYLNDIYLQPRISANFSIFKNWKINMAWGMYKQYIAELPLIDEYGNNFYYWGISDNSSLPLLSSQHNVFGISYNKNNLNISIEGYYNLTEGLTQTRMDIDGRRSIFETGKSRAKGIDFHVKKKILQHDLWVSYTLSKTEEYFPNPENLYRPSPHDQTHEIKGAAIFNFNPFYFSMNYVYGSGLAITRRLDKDIIPYNRFDIAFLYKFETQKFDLETGISVVNIFNTKNVGYSGFSNLPDNKTVYQRGIPFTPSIFIKIIL